MFLWQNAGFKHGKVLVLYIVSYFHDLIFQVDHVWTIRGTSCPNLKVKRDSWRATLTQRVTTILTICVPASRNHFSKYSLQSFYLILWQHAGLKHGKVLVPYIVRYFYDIRFEIDHVWTIRGTSFADLKDKRGLKERQPGPEGYHHEIYMCFCFK